MGYYAGDDTPHVEPEAKEQPKPPVPEEVPVDLTELWDFSESFLIEAS